MLAITLMAAGLLVQAAAGTPVDWRTQFESGKQAYAKHDYAEATARLNAAAEAAAAVKDGETGLLDTLRFLAGVYRETGDYAQAERVLDIAARHCGAADPNGIRLAAILEELTVVQRAQGHGDVALATIGKAIQIRESHTDVSRADLARDLTTASALLYKAGEAEKAIAGFERALKEWDAVLPGDPQALPAMEALATAYRDRSQYLEAEPLVLRALRLREAASGPESAEVIAAVDSLAYIEFGLKKFPEAEVLFRRLLALWEANGGPDHPMTALTHDKMAEFFAFQQRYGEAEKSARQALAVRTKLHLASLNQTGRMFLMEAKLAEAEELYQRAVQIGDLAQAPDDVLDPVLRVYAKILRELKRDSEADALELRVKNAILRRADKEGRRPSPVKLPAQ